MFDAGEERNAQDGPCDGAERFPPYRPVGLQRSGGFAGAAGWGRDLESPRE